MRFSLFQKPQNGNGSGGGDDYSLATLTRPSSRENSTSKARGKDAFGWMGPGSKIREAIDATDPLNVDSELFPSEYEGYVEPEPDVDDEALCTLAKDRFLDACTFRRPWEREAVLACAQAEGRQWLGWDDATQRAKSVMEESFKDRYVTHNLIRPLLLKSVSMATMSNPDADVAPDSDSQIDMDAASEGRVILAHLDRLWAAPQMRKRQAHWAALCGVAYIKSYWDPSAYCDVPIIGLDGVPRGKKSVQQGEVQRVVVPPLEIYFDPEAKNYEDARWCIHAVVKSLSYYVDRFGKVGRQVKADARDAYGDYGSAYTVGGYGGISQLPQWANASDMKAALCIEMWEKPTPRYPDGRFFVVAGDTLLYRSNGWPVTCRLNSKLTFPFSRVCYQEAQYHPYGQGLVKDLAPIQITYNRMLTRYVELLDEATKATVVRALGQEVPPDVFDGTNDGRNVRSIPYDPLAGGMPPTWMAPCPIPTDIYRLFDLAKADMEEIAGIHDVSRGNAPPGVTAGVAIELLQQGDQTQMSAFTGSIEYGAVVDGQIALCEYAEKVAPNLPRMMGLDDNGNPQAARRKAMAFRALTSGGSCSCYVVPGSATPKSPSGQIQEITDFLKNGFFGPPGTPQSALIAVKLIDMAKSDVVVEHLVEQMAHERAMQPSPADLATQQHAQEMQQQQAQLQYQQALMQMKSQFDQQHEASMAAIKEQIDTNKQNAEAERQIALANQKAMHEQQLQEMQNAHDRLLTMLDKIVPSLTGTLDPTAVVDLEEKLGLQGKVPPPPTPGTGKSTSGTGAQTNGQ